MSVTKPRGFSLHWCVNNDGYHVAKNPVKKNISKIQKTKKRNKHSRRPPRCPRTATSRWARGWLPSSPRLPTLDVFLGLTNNWFFFLLSVQIRSRRLLLRLLPDWVGWAESRPRSTTSRRRRREAPRTTSSSSRRSRSPPTASARPPRTSARGSCRDEAGFVSVVLCCVVFGGA